MLIIILQRLFVEACLDIVYFPVWWYTGGIKYIVSKFLHIVASGNEFLSPGLWLKNLFVPMFGQFDWQGRLVSFFMRLVQLIARGFALMVWVLLSLSIVIFWVLFPIIVIWGLVASFSLTT